MTNEIFQGEDTYRFPLPVVRDPTLVVSVTGRALQLTLTFRADCSATFLYAASARKYTAASVESEPFGWGKRRNEVGVQTSI